MAASRLYQGVHDACLVGGVTAIVTLTPWSGWTQIATRGSVSRSAFVPGEGAGFCLLMTTETCARLKLSSIVRLRAAAVGHETKLIKTSEMCFGEGLTATVGGAVRNLRLPTDKVSQVICDINGERYRGEEWGFACLRLSQYFDDPTGYLFSAECWGDVELPPEHYSPCSLTKPSRGGMPRAHEHCFGRARKEVSGPLRY